MQLLPYEVHIISGNMFNITCIKKLTLHSLSLVHVWSRVAIVNFTTLMHIVLSSCQNYTSFMDNYKQKLHDNSKGMEN
jgi:hypothetical protein